jgi:dynactin complex subunit
MKAWIPLSLGLLLSSAALAADPNCTYPSAAAPAPDGATATKDQMLAAKNDTARYNTEMNVYLDCLKAATDKLTPADTSKLSAEQKKKMDEQAKVLVAKNNAAVDELQAVVGRFNDQLKAYKAAHATPAPAQ